jgi:hypothetical protein
MRNEPNPGKTPKSAVDSGSKSTVFAKSGNDLKE